jgi:hypothetical protein
VSVRDASAPPRHHKRCRPCRGGRLMSETEPVMDYDVHHPRRPRPDDSESQDKVRPGTLQWCRHSSQWVHTLPEALLEDA